RTPFRGTRSWCDHTTTRRGAARYLASLTNGSKGWGDRADERLRLTEAIAEARARIAELENEQALAAERLHVLCTELAALDAEASVVVVPDSALPTNE